MSGKVEFGNISVEAIRKWQGLINRVAPTEEGTSNAIDLRAVVQLETDRAMMRYLEGQKKQMNTEVNGNTRNTVPMFGENSGIVSKRVITGFEKGFEEPER